MCNIQWFRKSFTIKLRRQASRYRVVANKPINSVITSGCAVYILLTSFQHKAYNESQFKCYFRNVLASLWAVCWKLVSSICTVGRYYRVVWFVGYNSITGCLRSELDCKTLSEPLFIAHMLSIPFFWSAAAAALPPSFAYPPFTYLCILPSTVLRFSA